VNGFDGPFSLGIAAGSDLVFVREFKTQKEATFAKPYTLDHIPNSAERALTKLETGDFVSFQTHLTLNVSLDKSLPITPAISFEAATHALISGNFLVHIYKVDKTHVRMKLIALRNVEAGAAAGFKLTGDLTVVAIKVASGRIRAAWNVDFGSVSKNYDITDLYMIDYILDLTNPRVAAAYDNLVQKKAAFKAKDMLYLESAKKNLSKVMVTDLSEFEQLYHESLDKPEKDRVVDRRFKGSTLTRTVRTKFNASVKTLRFSHETFFARNKISTVDPNENQLYYLFDTFSTFGERKIPFHLLDRTESVNSNLLFTATDSFEPVRFVGLYLTREYRTQSLSPTKLEELKKHVRNTLPASMYAQIPFDSWKLSGHEAVNVYFKHEVYFPLAAVQAIPLLEPATFKRRYQDYLNGLKQIESAPMRDIRPGHERDLIAMDAESLPRTEIYDRDLNLIVKQLSIVFNPKAETDERYEAFLKLKNNDLFVETGAGFLISLLPQDRLNDVLGYSLTLTGKDQKNISLRFGKPTESDIYRAMRYIQDLINSRNVDLRLLQDMKSTSDENPAAPARFQ
jgi:hypothetical protein